MDSTTMKAALAAQVSERTEHLAYSALAKSCKDAANAEVLRSIATAELAHAEFWKKLSGVEAAPKRLRAGRIILMARVLGITFALKLMERGETRAARRYGDLSASIPGLAAIAADEDAHERQLLGMLDEERLRYVGSIVLGLNDALVELTGALAGFTLALGDTKLITLAGLVTGISAAFSMAASDYLSSKAEGDATAGKSAIYTGVAYLITVILMIMPFLLIDSKFLSLGVTLCIVIAIIALFNYYISVAKELDFKRRFLEMALISMGVAAFSFGIGYVLKIALGIDA
ncbi:MAG: VIT1/CCC1 transporter family protein [Spirochaetaceae bacterium]|nr:VIT1/CCC1 transporter family protein [Spirochaetaceae bacterium]